MCLDLCDLLPAPPPQVNGKSVVGLQHSEVVAAIKAGGDETSMLVVDEETDGFFRRCEVLPTEEHLSGRTLPEPVGGALPGPWNDEQKDAALCNIARVCTCCKKRNGLAELICLHEHYLAFYFICRFLCGVGESRGFVVKAAASALEHHHLGKRDYTAGPVSVRMIGGNTNLFPSFF